MTEHTATILIDCALLLEDPASVARGERAVASHATTSEAIACIAAFHRSLGDDEIADALETAMRAVARFEGEGEGEAL